MAKKFKIADILAVDVKVYKPKSQYHHPYMYALKNICDKVGKQALFAEGKLTGAEAYLIASSFKKYKASLPPKNRRYTAAQYKVLQKLETFANKHFF